MFHANEGLDETFCKKTCDLHVRIFRHWSLLNYKNRWSLTVKGSEHGVYSTQNYCAFGLFPSSGVLGSRNTTFRKLSSPPAPDGNISSFRNVVFLLPRTLDDGKSPNNPSNSVGGGCLANIEETEKKNGDSVQECSTHIVVYLLKARTVKPAQTAVARQHP
jgi:hypothetical protein